jgi:O-acetyl-ADP-ribose deacetylase
MNRLEVIAGDITETRVDAIVNAANECMLGGGGVDGAIHSAAGPELLEACRAVPEVRRGVRCPTGEARLTPAFKLPARYVVHTVGPVWRGGKHGEPELLASCYRESLKIAAAHGAKSIAFPAISTGAFLYPLHSASTIAIRECEGFLERHPSFVKIVLVAFREEDARVFRKLLSATRSSKD